MTAHIRVGASAWTEKTLIASGWYPRKSRDAEARLRYYAERFPITEVDSTYYALPRREHAVAWVGRTPSDFVFDVKAYAPFTTHYTDPRRLPRDLSATLPLALRERDKIYPHELPDELYGEMVRRFDDALAPLEESGKLGVVLFQYPVWFPYSREHLRVVAGTRELMPRYRIAIEFRNRTWMSERHRDETLALLREHDLVYTCVDEPQGFTSSVPPIAAVTSRIALVRLHGRNAGTWEGPSETAADRMAYLYSEAELDEWAPRVRALAREADEVHVIMNNCHRDFAVRNAETMTGLLRASR